MSVCPINASIRPSIHPPNYPPIHPPTHLLYLFHFSHIKPPIPSVLNVHTKCILLESSGESMLDLLPSWVTNFAANLCAFLGSFFAEFLHEFLRGKFKEKLTEKFCFRLFFLLKKLLPKLLPKVRDHCAQNFTWTVSQKSVQNFDKVCDQARKQSTTVCGLKKGLKSFVGSFNATASTHLA